MASHFAEKDCAAIAELRYELPKLVSCVGLSKRLGALGNAIAG